MMNQTQTLIPYLSLILIMSFSSPHLLAGEEKEVEIAELLDLSLEELLNVKVTTATKTPVENALSPAAVTVVTAEDIATFGYTSVAEILRHAVSFVDTDDLVMPNFGVRGIHAGLRAGSRTIKFLLDGQPTAFRATSQNFIGPEFIPMDLIERIEIVRGPVSSLYGANAFLGVVNIITRQGQSYQETGDQFSISAHHTEAAKNGYQLALTGGKQSDHWNYVAGISFEQNDRAGLSLPRPSPLYDSLTTHTAATDKAQPVSLYGKVKWDLTKERNLQLSVHYQRLEADNAFTDLNPLQTTGVSRVALDNGFIRLDYRDKLSEQLNTHLFLAYARGGPTQDDQIEVGAKEYVLNRDWGYSSMDFGAELVWSPNTSHTFLLGVDYTDEHQDIEAFSQVNRVTQEETPLNSPLSKTLLSKGLYTQWQYDLTDQWHATLSYRFDRQDVAEDDQHSARFSLVGELPHDLVVKLMIGNAFQAPSPELLFRRAVQVGDIIGNPNLDVQSARTAEVSLSIPLREKTIYLTTTGFMTKVSDLVSYKTSVSNYFASNSSGSTTRGLEVELQYQKADWRAYLNGLFQHTKIDDDPYNLFVLNERQHSVLFPKYAANFGLSYTWQSAHVTLSWDNRYVGERPASTQNVVTAHHFYELADYLDSTLSVSTSAFSLIRGKSANLRFQIRDLFDTQYVNAGFGGIEIPSLGRRYWLTFEQRF